MAAKIKLMKMLQEFRGFANITARQPVSRQPGLFLMQLRAQANPSTQAKARRIINIDMHDSPDIPHPVKITHLAVQTSA
ncbi:MAG TPA: hypothetical protein VHH88_07385 [Verrucomicrobiae bacterium]|nr:hypothetical protein [Verrucomicrobiae bacterium]